jgi:hypothetical protein
MLGVKSSWNIALSLDSTTAPALGHAPPRRMRNLRTLGVSDEKPAQGR